MSTHTIVLFHSHELRMEKSTLAFASFAFIPYCFCLLYPFLSNQAALRCQEKSQRAMEVFLSILEAEEGWEEGKNGKAANMCTCFLVFLLI